MTTTTAAPAALAVPLADYVFTVAARRPREMKFRVRLYENDPWTVALMTDLGDANPGCSLTAAAEYAIPAVQAYWPHRAARLIFVEHYDDRPHTRALAVRHRRPVEMLGRINGESFDLVSLETPTRPRWKRTTKEKVEELIGGRLP
jgi:hypothetical protein